MKIAITGANGYIGSTLVKKCLNNGFETIAIDIKNNYIDKRAVYKKIDIFENTDNIYESLGSPDVLIHLAWRKGFVHNDIAHLEDLNKHYTFLINMVNSGIKYISVMGSMHEIGYHEGVIDENTPCNPMSVFYQR